MAAMRKARTGSLRTVAVMLLAGALGGCAIPIRLASVSSDVPRDTTPKLVHDGVAALDDAETKKRLQHLMASPEMKAIEREAAAGLLDASLASLDDASRQQRISAMTERYAGGIMTAISHQLSTDMGPIARSVAQSAVRGALDEAMGKTGKTGDAEGDASATADRQASLRTVVREQVAPAMADVLADPEFQRAIGEIARVMGREAVVGANESLHHLEDKPRGEPSLLDKAGMLARGGAHLMTTLTWALIAVVVLLGAWIAKLVFQTRRAAARAAQAQVSLEAETAASPSRAVGAGRSVVRARADRPVVPARKAAFRRRRSRDVRG